MSENKDLAAITLAREARKADLRKQWEAQRVIDLQAVDALEVEFGDSNIATLDVPYTPGLPTLAAVCCPSPAQVKRYQYRVKPKGKDGSSEAIEGAEELATACLKYPDKETYAKLLEARPAIHVQLGAAAVGLAVGSAEAKGKD